jgi:hypothetical protein
MSLAHSLMGHEEEVTQMTAEKVLAALQDEGGTVIRTSLDESKEEALRTAPYLPIVKELREKGVNVLIIHEKTLLPQYEITLAVSNLCCDFTF